MRIAYATRSRFLPACEAAIAQVRAALIAGETIRVIFEDGGYAGRVTVAIQADDSSTFNTDWVGTEETRFPARIKAAATALFNSGYRGRFLVTHADGVLERSRQ